ncbi:hypothetical protein D7207_39400, partial [Burkholderia cepacia]
SVRGARGLTQWAIAQLLAVMSDLTESERRKLASTSIYVSPEEARMRREAAKYHARLTRKTSARENDQLVGWGMRRPNPSTK